MKGKEGRDKTHCIVRAQKVSCTDTLMSFFTCNNVLLIYEARSGLALGKVVSVV